VLLLLFFLRKCCEKTKKKQQFERKERMNKKNFVFATCPTALKGVLSFLKQSNFWTKEEARTF
jgi:hypothetical protein